MRLGLILLIYLMGTSQATSADFKCAHRYWNLELWGLSGLADEDADGKSTLCSGVLLSGRIVPEDVAGFTAWLTKPVCHFGVSPLAWWRRRDCYADRPDY